MKKRLENRLRKIKEEIDALVKVAKEDGDRDFTEEEQGKVDTLLAESTQVKSQLATLTGVEQFNESLQQSSGRQVPPADPTSGRIDPVERQPDPMGGFRDAAEFALAVRTACRPGGERDERLNVLGAPTNYHNESTGSDGYLVPPQMRQNIFELVFEQDDLLTQVDSEPTAGNTVDLLADESTPWGSVGVQAAWRSEGGQMTASRLNTVPRTVRLNELYAFVTATDDLIEDAPRLANRLTQQAARAIRWKANDAIIYGSGVGQPLGWFTSDALITITEETSQAADTVVAGNVLKMFSRLFPTSIPRSHWRINPDIMPQLMTMTIGDQPVYVTPQAGLKEAPGGLLLGRPVKLCDHCKTLGDKGDIQLVDPMGYYLARKQGGVQFASSMHLFFDYGISAFRWTFRLGGMPYLSAPISPANGSSTRSHFVVIEDRTGS